MVAPKSFQDCLKKRVISMEMLSEAIYSVSKRAKHHRDMERRYRADERLRRSWNHYYYDKYDNADKSAQRKDHYYQQKDTMLGLLEPSAIHTSEHPNGGRDIYLVYECGIHSFHKLVRMGVRYKDEFEALLAETTKEHPGLKVTEIPDLFVQSAELPDILSAQFTDKVVALIESGDYTLEQSA